ncbi:MAG TPA: hypothetical protein VF767_12490 [Bryobacteraceae bacterium]
MLRFVWRATRGYRLCPWRSPYLRWRIETYWGLHAETLGFRDFLRFGLAHWRDLLRFLRWAGRMERWQRSRGV